MALLAAGTNAIILAAFIKEMLGTVAFHIGHGMESLARGYFYDEYAFLEKYIGIDKINGNVGYRLIQMTLDQPFFYGNELEGFKAELLTHFILTSLINETVWLVDLGIVSRVFYFYFEPILEIVQMEIVFVLSTSQKYKRLFHISICIY